MKNYSFLGIFFILLLVSPAVAQDAPRQVFRHSFSASAGYLHVIELLNTAKAIDFGYTDIKGGPCVRLAYDYKTSKWFAIGAIVENNNLFKSSHVSKHENIPSKININTTYIAPQLTFNFPIKFIPKLFAQLRYGTGVVVASEKVTANYLDGFEQHRVTLGWAVNLAYGLEWRFKETIGLTFDANFGQLDFKEFYRTEDFTIKEWVVIQQAIFLCGIRIHL